MIDIRYVSQQVELTFWNIAIESMSVARRITARISPAKFSWRGKKVFFLKSLALSGLGVTIGFVIGFALL